MDLMKEIKVSDPIYWQSKIATVHIYTCFIYIEPNNYNKISKLYYSFNVITVESETDNILVYYERASDDSIILFAQFERIKKEIYDTITDGANKESIMNLGFKEILK